MKDFKPIKQEKTVISIRLDNELLKNIDNISAQTDISRNEFIIQCIEYRPFRFWNLACKQLTRNNHSTYQCSHVSSKDNDIINRFHHHGKKNIQVKWKVHKENNRNS